MHSLLDDPAYCALKEHYQATTNLEDAAFQAYFNAASSSLEEIDKLQQAWQEAHTAANQAHTQIMHFLLHHQPDTSIVTRETTSEQPVTVPVTT